MPQEALIGRYTGTDTTDWHGKDCARIDFHGADVRSPYFGDPSLWDEGGEVPLADVMERLRARRTAEGIVIGVEPLRNPGLYRILKEIRTVGLGIRIETWGTRPLQLDDFAGARMVESVLVELTASPDSPCFPEAMPGADPAAVSDTLDLLDGLEIETEVELVAVPGIADADSVRSIAKHLGKRTVFTIRQFDPRKAHSAAAKGLEPLSKKEISALRDAIRPYPCKSGIRWV